MGKTSDQRSATSDQDPDLFGDADAEALRVIFNQPPVQGTSAGKRR
jgi:hypothetical protein